MSNHGHSILNTLKRLIIKVSKLKYQTNAGTRLFLQRKHNANVKRIFYSLLYFIAFEIVSSSETSTLKKNFQIMVVKNLVELLKFCAIF